MQKNNTTYDVLLLNDEAYLESTLTHLLAKELVEIDSSNHYRLSAAGKNKAADFTSRYSTLLTYFDIFSAVDLAEGSFAFAKFNDYESTSAWQHYLNNQRWEDLRIPIIEHLGGSALELVFCQFVQENRLNHQNTYWPLEMNSGQLLNEILEICNTAITPGDLAYSDDNNEGDTISGESVLADIAEQGFRLLRELQPSDSSIHTNLQTWYPLKDQYNYDLPMPIPGWETPIWQTPWNLDSTL